MVLSKRELCALLERHCIAPRRQWGQNFLVDRQFYQAILAAAEVGPEDWVIEIGTGAGTLTECLAREAEHVLTVEKDERLWELARSRLASLENVTFWLGDALASKSQLGAWQDLLPKDRKVRLVANLPYQIASPLLILCLHELSLLPSTVLVQREVAEKIVAQPRQKKYGRLSVVAQSLAQMEILRHVPPQVFYPPPKVDSSLLRLSPLSEPLFSSAWREFDLLTRHLFQKRRKKLRKSLAELDPRLLEVARELGISLESRPEELSPCEYGHLALRWSQR